MRLSVNLVRDFAYSAGSTEFPIEIEISSDVPTEIHSRVDLTGVFLTRLGTEEPTAGYSRTVFPHKRTLVPLRPENPLRLRMDGFCQDAGFEDLTPGSYLWEVSVGVGENVDERIRYEKLHGSVEVVLA